MSDPMLHLQVCKVLSSFQDRAAEAGQKYHGRRIPTARISTLCDDVHDTATELIQLLIDPLADQL